MGMRANSVGHCASMARAHIYRALLVDKVHGVLTGSIPVHLISPQLYKLGMCPNIATVDKQANVV